MPGGGGGGAEHCARRRVPPGIGHHPQVVRPTVGGVGAENGLIEP